MQASKQESGRALPAAVCCLRGVLHGFSYVFEVVCCRLFSQCASLIPICHVAVVLPVVGVFNQVLFALVACRFSIVMCGFCCHIKIPPETAGDCRRPLGRCCCDHQPTATVGGNLRPGNFATK